MFTNSKAYRSGGAFTGSIGKRPPQSSSTKAPCDNAQVPQQRAPVSRYSQSLEERLLRMQHQSAQQSLGRSETLVRRHRDGQGDRQGRRGAGHFDPRSPGDRPQGPCELPESWGCCSAGGPERTNKRPLVASVRDRRILHRRITGPDVQGGRSMSFCRHRERATDRSRCCSDTPGRTTRRQCAGSSPGNCGSRAAMRRRGPPAWSGRIASRRCRSDGRARPHGSGTAPTLRTSPDPRSCSTDAPA